MIIIETRLLAWTAILVAMVFGICGCVKSSDGFVTKLERSALAVVGSAEPTVTVSAATDFQWDKLYVFGPYTPVEKIHAQLGYHWSEAGKTAIQASDTFYLLVFMKNGQVISHYKFPRTIGDFHNLEAKNGFSPGDDAFEIKTATAGETKRLILVPKKN